MLIRSLILLTLIIVSYSGYGQKSIERIGKRASGSFVYYVLKPQKKVEGILLLLPGLGETPKEVFQQTDLPTLLAEHGFISIVPDLEKALIADSITMAGLDTLLQQCDYGRGIKRMPVFIGGFSRGGSISLRYTEYLVVSGSMINLKGVFAIDPALDLKRLYLSSVRKVNYDCSDLVKREGAFIKNYLEEKLNGSPKANHENYIRYSIFSAGVQKGGNAKFLKNIPLRLYSEPDLQFVRDKYCDELREDDINAHDLEKLYFLLREMGNKRCEYITTVGKGFHSWRILDTRDCLKWMLSLMKKPSSGQHNP